MHKFNTLAFLLVATLGSGGARAEFVDRTCFGNLETFDRQIIKAGISYKLSYLMSGESAKVRFAGRELNVKAERGKAWIGVWLKRMDEDIHFSFLPSEGGTTNKFRFKPDQWYSGKQGRAARGTAPAGKS
jgi:hypothetical protein